jgi:hypothetical protein
VVTGLPGTNAGMVVTGTGEPSDPCRVTFTIPAGRTGINPRGDYSSVTAYDPRDMVTDNGSSWVALQATTGNAPPVLPTTANAYWQLAARRGIDGTGIGDVVGPNGVTAGRVAAFGGTSGKVLVDSGKLAADLVTGPAVSVDGALVGYSGTSGKVLKALTSAEAKSWLATTAIDVVFSSATANLPRAPATVQAAIESLSNSGGRNDALLALEIADLKGVRLGMRNGLPTLLTMQQASMRRLQQMRSMTRQTTGSRRLQRRPPWIMLLFSQPMLRLPHSANTALDTRLQALLPRAHSFASEWSDLLPGLPRCSPICSSVALRQVVTHGTWTPLQRHLSE